LLTAHGVSLVIYREKPSEATHLALVRGQLRRTPKRFPETMSRRR
jgi:hypothetical protein